MNDQAAAILTIHSADRLTYGGRFALASWLRARAEEIERTESDVYQRTFRARYFGADWMFKKALPAGRGKRR